MNIKKVLFLTLFLSGFIFLTPKIAKAADSSSKSILDNSVFLKIKETVQYFFTFGTDKKVTLLEKQAENRLNIAQDYADNGDQTKVQNSLQNYLQTKEKQDNLLDKVNDSAVLDVVQERTVTQQKTMEEIKMKVDEDTKQEIIQVQEQVVNQVAQRVVVINGPEGQTEFFNKVEHVWAPGTGPGGEAGVVYEGGSKIMFAPGTSAGGESGVKYEGGAGQQYAPGTSAGGNGNADVKTVEVKSN
ncbi:MAG: DUF5667 domain-containing protein [Candidatus Shapirobacteria bacterium]|nr:DUF5667 domain-containing protein [Candidatus Shapirobacteria bacterium]